MFNPLLFIEEPGFTAWKMSINEEVISKLRKTIEMNKIQDCALIIRNPAVYRNYEPLKTKIGLFGNVLLDCLESYVVVPGVRKLKNRWSNVLHTVTSVKHLKHTHWEKPAPHVTSFKQNLFVDFHRDTKFSWQTCTSGQILTSQTHTDPDEHVSTGVKSLRRSAQTALLWLIKAW